jgi:uncharacterized protein YecT (DUF1311 family)
MRDLAIKLGVSIATACAGGTAWIVAEPSARTMVANFIGADAPAAAPGTAPAAATGGAQQVKLDLTRNPDAKPSFNCADAASTIEHLICSDPAIAEADQSLARIWKTLREQDKVTEDVQMSQRQWLATRDACLIADNPKACVRHEMLSRIQTLGAL